MGGASARRRGPRLIELVISRAAPGSAGTNVPILKREPEIFPSDLFGGEGESGDFRGGEPAAGNGHPRHPGVAMGGGPGHDAGSGASSNGTGVANGNGCRQRAGAGYTNGNGHRQARSAWWVAHVRSRQEKHLGRQLLDQRISYYLPQREQRIRRMGRWQSSFLPLFPGYPFLRGTPLQRAAALRSNLIVNLLAVDDEALLEGELRALWQLQCSGAPLVPHPFLTVCDAVEIIHGPFQGYRGTVLREKGSYRLVVSITLLRKSVATELDREVLAPDRQPAVAPAATRHRPRGRAGTSIRGWG
jgi:hypothetical protein